MDFRVRILLQIFAYSFICEGVNTVEEIPPPLKEHIEPDTNSSVQSERWTTINMTALPLSLNATNTSLPEPKSSVIVNVSQQTISDSVVPTTAILLSSNKPRSADLQPVQSNNVINTGDGVPEFEDRNELDEGGKGDEDIASNADEVTSASPPADNEAVGEGVAKEDTEPLKDKDRDENQLGAMVEDAKGNVAVPHTRSQFQSHIDFDQTEDSHFMMIVVLGGMLVFCFYLVYHNKKKILGLIFEGRASSHTRRNVRYRRLSQREEHDNEGLGK